MSISTEYQKNIGKLARSNLRDIVSSRPSTTVKDIRELLGVYPELGEMTLSELLGVESDGPKAPKKGASPKKESKKSGGGKSKKSEDKKASGDDGQWNTRTEEGRAEIDAAVLEALASLGGDLIRSEAIRGLVGATPSQVRESLNRHIAAGTISYQGQARGTSYSIL
jgi:hypothetical protein